MLFQCTMVESGLCIIKRPPPSHKVQSLAHCSDCTKYSGKAPPWTSWCPPLGTGRLTGTLSSVQFPLQSVGKDDCCQYMHQVLISKHGEMWQGHVVTRGGWEPQCTQGNGWEQGQKVADAAVTGRKWEEGVQRGAVMGALTCSRVTL